MGGGCLASGSQRIKEHLEEAIRTEGLEKAVSVVGTGCLGPLCAWACNSNRKDKVFYQNVAMDDSDDIVHQHLKNNNS
jgi:(2Fe-2S) ferredoxin